MFWASELPEGMLKMLGQDTAWLQPKLQISLAKTLPISGLKGSETSSLELWEERIENTLDSCPRESTYWGRRAGQLKAVSKEAA